MADTATAPAPKLKPTGLKGKMKQTKPARPTPLTLAEIEHLAGPVDFNNIYEHVDEPVRRKLFATAAAQQLKDFVQQARTPGKDKPALNDADLAAAIKAWSPVVKRRGIGAVAKAAKFVTQMTAEEKEALRQLLESP